MRDDEIDTMRADLPPAAESEAPTEAGNAAEDENPAAAVPRSLPDAELVNVAIVPLVRIAGQVLTSRGKVSDLDEEEVQQLALALANVAAQYQFSMSPRSAAWLGVAIVSSAIIERRKVEWRNRKPQPTLTQNPSLDPSSTPAGPVLPSGDLAATPSPVS